MLAGVHDTATEVTVGDPEEEEEPVPLVPPQAAIQTRIEKAARMKPGRRFKRLLLALRCKRWLNRKMKLRSSCGLPEQSAE